MLSQSSAVSVGIRSKISRSSCAGEAITLRSRCSNPASCSLDGQFQFAGQIHLGDPVDIVDGRRRADRGQRLLRLGDRVLSAGGRIVGVLALAARAAEIDVQFREQLQFGVDPLLRDGVDGGGSASAYQSCVRA